MDQALNENTAIIPEVRWNFWKKYFFRFTAVYFFIYIFPFPFNVIEILYEPVFIYYDGIWHIAAQWFGENVLHLPYYITVFTNGSGDTTYNYVQTLMFLILAIVLSGIWTALDRKRVNYKKLSYWIFTFVRYYLAFNMLSYGFAKVFKVQFPFPSEMRLNETYGQSTPMGLIWTFMGYSPGYNYFTGGAEVLAGLLLFFRRTTTYGSLVAITVISNIVMINFCYDVPVKLFSLHLLLMAIFILSFDIKRVVRFFFLNKSVPPVEITPIFSNKKYNRTALIIKIIVICLLLFTTVQTHLKYVYLSSKQVNLLFKGTYDVENITPVQKTAETKIDDPERWKEFYVSPEGGYVSIKTQNDSVQSFNYYVSTADKTISIINAGLLEYKDIEPGKFSLTGRFKSNSFMNMILTKKDVNYNLVNRGFHWINEYPFNR